MIALHSGKSVGPLPVAVTMGSLAVLVPIGALVLNEKGWNLDGPWILIVLSYVAGFWMTRAISLWPGVAFATICGMVVAIAGMLTLLELGTRTAPPLRLVVIWGAAVGAVFGMVGGVVAFVLRRLNPA
jgi:hypothetical protein